MRILSLLLLTAIVSVNVPALAQPDGQEADPGLPEGIMAKRGEGTVSREMFDAKVARIPERDRTGVLRSGSRVQRMLVDLLLNAQLANEARKVGFDEGDVRYRMQLAAETELANAWLDHYVDSQPDADYRALAYEYYLVNKEDLKTAPSRDVTHLLVSSEERPVEEAEALAASLLEQVQADPEVFDQLVVQHSEDPSVSSNKGHFREVKAGDMVKPFEESAFGLEKPGDFSGLVQTRFGFHILRLDGINPPRIPEFEEVRNALEAMQRKKHKERVRYTYLESLTGQKATISEEEIKSMIIRYFGEDALKDSEAPAESG